MRWDRVEARVPTWIPLHQAAGQLDGLAVEAELAEPRVGRRMTGGVGSCVYTVALAAAWGGARRSRA